MRGKIIPIFVFFLILLNCVSIQSQSFKTINNLNNNNKNNNKLCNLSLLANEYFNDITRKNSLFFTENCG